MPSNHTPNYQLSQWEADDQVHRTDFNADNAKIDAALAGKGNCKIITGTYVGTGTAGEKAPTVVTFPAKPLLALIYLASSPMIVLYGSAYGTQLGGSQSYNKALYTTWNGNTLSFYNNTSGASASSQLNEAGKTYHYIIFVEA